MNREEFEKLVAQAIEALPEEFLEKLDNVAVLVEDWPSVELMESLGLGKGSLLFGLYQGVPPTKRNFGLIMPDKITIFSGPIQLVAKTPEDIKEKVTQTVRHEIAHHFGMGEAQVRERGY